MYKKLHLTTTGHKYFVIHKICLYKTSIKHFAIRLEIFKHNNNMKKTFNQIDITGYDLFVLTFALITKSINFYRAKHTNTAKGTILMTVLYKPETFEKQKK
ncbi:hypothetical protein CVS40_3926 [Lucilia cuprina]|nr:hypothetical protein CVS40_3926 [Lucilia cuprina]